MTSSEQFEAWWNADEQEELRKSCAIGWGLKIWQASREAVVVDLPVITTSLDWLVCVEVMESEHVISAIRAAGIKVRGG